eukprot:scaffold124968_cov32-Tisochrysis_lutea.AAC.1
MIAWRISAPDFSVAHVSTSSPPSMRTSTHTSSHSRLKHCKAVEAAADRVATQNEVSAFITDYYEANPDEVGT